jgi:hypothetical protein
MRNTIEKEEEIAILKLVEEEMGDGVQHPRCPFYPESCEVERHANMQHRWKGVTTASLVAARVVEEAKRPVLPVTHKPTLPTPLPTVEPEVVGNEKVTGTLKLGDTARVKAWREKNRERDNARRREYMAKRRADGKG